MLSGKGRGLGNAPRPPALSPEPPLRDSPSPTPLSLCQRGPQAAWLDGKPAGRAGIMGPRSGRGRGRSEAEPHVPRLASLLSLQRSGRRPSDNPSSSCRHCPPRPHVTHGRPLATWAPRSTSSGPRCQVRCGRGFLPASGTGGPVPAPPLVVGFVCFFQKRTRILGVREKSQPLRPNVKRRLL